jgi:hypothetical protein
LGTISSKNRGDRDIVAARDAYHHEEFSISPHMSSIDDVHPPAPAAEFCLPGTPSESRPGEGLVALVQDEVTPFDDATSQQSAGSQPHTPGDVPKITRYDDKGENIDRDSSPVSSDGRRPHMYGQCGCG